MGTNSLREGEGRGAAHVSATFVARWVGLDPELEETVELLHLGLEPALPFADTKDLRVAGRPMTGDGGGADGSKVPLPPAAAAYSPPRCRLRAAAAG